MERGERERERERERKERLRPGREREREERRWILLGADKNKTGPPDMEFC